MRISWNIACIYVLPDSAEVKSNCTPGLDLAPNLIKWRGDPERISRFGFGIYALENRCRPASVAEAYLHVAPAVRTQSFPPFGLLRLPRLPSRLAWRAEDGLAVLLRAHFFLSDMKRMFHIWKFTDATLGSARVWFPSLTAFATAAFVIPLPPPPVSAIWAGFQPKWIPARMTKQQKSFSVFTWLRKFETTS